MASHPDRKYVACVRKTGTSERDPPQAIERRSKRNWQQPRSQPDIKQDSIVPGHLLVEGSHAASVPRREPTMFKSASSTSSSETCASGGSHWRRTAKSDLTVLERRAWQARFGRVPSDGLGGNRDHDPMSTGCRCTLHMFGVFIRGLGDTGEGRVRGCLLPVQSLPRCCAMEYLLPAFLSEPAGFDIQPVFNFLLALTPCLAFWLSRSSQSPSIHNGSAHYRQV